MAGTISFPGMGGSQDFNSIIDALVQAKRKARITPLENWKATWETKIDTISTVDSALSSFYNVVRGMDRIQEFMARTAASSNKDVLTATASSTAGIGTHTLIVNQLAQAEVKVHNGIQNGIQYHSGVADKDASINGSGSDKTFKYSYNGSTRTIDVEDGKTLEDLVSAINSDGENPGVTAKIVSQGGLYHLVLVEDLPDGAHEIVIDPDHDMTLNGADDTTDLTGATFTQTVNASGTDKILELKYGADAAVQITVPTGTTLTGLKDLVNAAGMGIRASLLNDGGSGTGSVHLVLTGKDMGAEHTITIGDATTLDGTGDTEGFKGLFTTSLEAQNSQVRLNGYPASGWIERPNNSLTDVIEGVSLNLLTEGTTTVTISTDTEGIVDKVEEFKDAFNAVRKAIQNATYYDDETGKKGILLGNYALQIVKSRLDSLVSASAPGFKDPDDPYSNLQQVGFSTDTTKGSETEGLLVLDTDALKRALESNPDAVADLFSAYLEGVTDSTSITFQSSLYTATPGVYDVEVDTDAGQGRFRLSGGNWGAWVPLSGTSGNYTLTGTSGPEKGIHLKLNLTEGSGSHTAQLRLKNGVMVRMSNELENLLGGSGPLQTLTSNYNDIIKNIDLRVEQEESRLELYEKSLLARFARLDTYMSKMTALSSSLASMTAKK